MDLGPLLAPPIIRLVCAYCGTPKKDMYIQCANCGATEGRIVEGKRIDPRQVSPVANGRVEKL